MGSTRLPGKVLADLGGQPLLALLLTRLRCGAIEDVVVATSELPGDDPVADLAGALDVPVIRGSEADVLSRYALAIGTFAPDHVVRITADCPLIDPAVIVDAVDHHVAVDADYTSNTLARTFPDGLDVEVLRASALQIAADEAEELDEREHVTPFVYRRPSRFRLGCICSGDDLGAERWTVDTVNDLEWLRAVVGKLADAATAPWTEILDVAGRSTSPARGSVWLRPVCWSDVAFRRAWDVLVDGAPVGSVEVAVTEPGHGTLDYVGALEHRPVATDLTRDALRADKQIVSLTV